MEPELKMLASGGAGSLDEAHELDWWVFVDQPETCT